MTFTWGQFHTRYLRHESVKLAWKLFTLFHTNPTGACEFNATQHWHYQSDSLASKWHLDMVHLQDKCLKNSTTEATWQHFGVQISWGNNTHTTYKKFVVIKLVHTMDPLPFKGGQYIIKSLVVWWWNILRNISYHWLGYGLLPAWW